MVKILIIDMGAVWGGQEVYSQNLAEVLNSSGYVVTHTSSQLKHKKSSKSFFKIGYRWIDFFGNISLLNKLIAQNNVIIFNGNRAIQQSLFLKKSCKFIGVKHGPFAVSKPSLIGKLLINLLYYILFLRLEKIICVAQITYEECRILAKRKSLFLPNGVKGPKYFKTKLYSDQLNTVFCGRLVNDKGIMIIIEAIRQINVFKPNSIKLNIFGEGPLQDTIQEFIKSNYLEEVVCLNGFVDNRDLIYSHSNLMLFASKFEGMPLSILEAFSYGIPVLAFKAPGVSEVVINGENGIIIDDNQFNPEKMKDELWLLLNNQTLLNRLSNKSRESFINKYAFDSMFKSFVKELN